MKIQIIGKRLKDLRIEKNLTQKDLAEILEISTQALSKKEKLDKTTLKETQVRLIEEHTWIKRDFLTGDVEKPYERIGEDGKILINPLKKDVILSPISRIAQTLDKRQAKLTLKIMEYIASSNNYQLDLLENICEAVFKTPCTKDC